MSKTCEKCGGVKFAANEVSGYAGAICWCDKTQLFKVEHHDTKVNDSEIETLKGIIAMQADALRGAEVYLIPRVSTNGVTGRTVILPAIQEALTASSETVSSYLNEVRAKALEHCAQYFDVLDETFPMTPPQISASIRRQAATCATSELRTNKGASNE